MSDLLLRGIDAVAGLRVVVALSTDSVIEGVRRHGARGVGACALGRTLTASALLATLTKGAERVTLQLEGDGPVGGLVADAAVDANGAAEIRGYLAHPEAAAEPCPSVGGRPGRCRVETALGRHGVVNVLRDLGLKERYQGQVSLLTGEIDEDIEGYLRISEQVPSALGCDVLVTDAGVVGAAGLLVQSLPEGDHDAVRPIQHALRTGAIFDWLAAGGGDARSLAEAVYGGVFGRPIDFLAEQPLLFRCRCSRERVEAILRMLTPVDIDEMIAEHGHAEVLCNFCNEKFIVAGEDLERVRAELARGPRERN